MSTSRAKQELPNRRERWGWRYTRVPEHGVYPCGSEAEARAAVKVYDAELVRRTEWATDWEKAE